MHEGGGRRKGRYRRGEEAESRRPLLRREAGRGSLPPRGRRSVGPSRDVRPQVPVGPPGGAARRALAEARSPARGGRGAGRAGVATAAPGAARHLRRSGRRARRGRGARSLAPGTLRGGRRAPGAGPRGVRGCRPSGKARRRSLSPGAASSLPISPARRPVSPVDREWEKGPASRGGSPPAPGSRVSAGLRHRALPAAGCVGLTDCLPLGVGLHRSKKAFRRAPRGRTAHQRSKRGQALSVSLGRAVPRAPVRSWVIAVPSPRAAPCCCPSPCGAADTDPPARCPV